MVFHTWNTGTLVHTCWCPWWGERDVGRQYGAAWPWWLAVHLQVGVAVVIWREQTHFFFQWYTTTARLGSNALLTETGPMIPLRICPDSVCFLFLPSISGLDPLRQKSFVSLSNGVLGLKLDTWTNRDYRSRRGSIVLLGYSGWIPLVCCYHHYYHPVLRSREYGCSTDTRLHLSGPLRPTPRSGDPATTCPRRTPRWGDRSLVPPVVPWTG